MTELWLLNFEDIVKLVKNKTVLYLNLDSSFNIIVIFNMSHWTLEEEITPVIVQLQIYWALKSSTHLWRIWILEGSSEYPWLNTDHIHSFIYSFFNIYCVSSVYQEVCNTLGLQNLKKTSKMFIIWWQKWDSEPKIKTTWSWLLSSICSYLICLYQQFRRPGFYS